MAARMKPALLVLVFAGASAMQAPESYSALGTEPFWSVAIEDGRLTYESPDGPNFSAPAPAPTTAFNGRSHVVDRLVLNAVHAQCSDGMSDNIYADTVIVVVDGVIARGCGGGIVAPGTLANSHWLIREIDGQSVFEEGYFLEFGPDRLNGLAGCNRFAGAYRREEDRLVAGPIAATRMACPAPGISHERRVLEILGRPVAIAFSDDHLLLSGGDGTIRLDQVIN